MYAYTSTCEFTYKFKNMWVWEMTADAIYGE